MPIVGKSNNRVLPNNARAADVAKSSVERILDVQARRYSSAFEVKGYEGILYNALTRGIACACHSTSRGLPKTLLDEKGNASHQDINSMLTGGADFRVKLYGLKPSNLVKDAPQQDSVWDIDTPSTREDDPFFDIVPKNGKPGTPFDVYASDENDDPRAGTIIEDGVGPNGAASIPDIDELVNDFDGSMFGLTDVSCPVCFGTGWIGGFNVFNGWRKVLNHQYDDAFFEGNVLNTDATVPYINTEYVRFDRVMIPARCVGVDAVRAFADRKILGATVLVDGSSVASAQQMLRYADGSQHTIELQFDERLNFTHLELQFNQSHKSARFEFPRTNKSGQQTMLDATQSVTLNLPPSIPMIQPKDIFVDSTFNKAWQITSVNNWNTRTYKTLGWDCDARVVQPAELYNLLPRRRPIQSMKTITQVRDNGAGHRRT